MSNNLKTHYIKATLKSPLHIGTGETYEPFNFIIDDEIFYYFNEAHFYHALPEIKQEALNIKIDTHDLMQIINFYKDNKDIGKSVAHYKCQTTKKVQDRYNTKTNKDNTKSENQWHIQQIYKNPNTFRPVIPGSSIKGMLGTTLGIYNSSQEDRQNLVISDALCLEGQVQIGYSYRENKNPDKKSKNSIPTVLEVVRPEAVFLFSIKTVYSWNDLINEFSRYYTQRENGFYEKLNKKNLVRLGRYSGKEFMVDSMSDAKNHYGKKIATHTIYESGEPFGWMEFSLIDEETYNKGIEQILESDKKIINEIGLIYKAVADEIKVKKEKQKAKLEEEARKKEAKLKAKLEEEARKKEEELKRQEELKKLSPLEREIITLQEANPTTPKDTLLYQALEQGKFKENRKEALEYLCKLMKENGNWKESGKPPKKVKRTQQVLAWLDELN
jgi:CRISPR/Cas system CSM-associated protein Csm3 (group 7 of RAMP superfamily)